MNTATAQSLWAAAVFSCMLVTKLWERSRSLRFVLLRLILHVGIHSKITNALNLRALAERRGCHAVWHDFDHGGLMNGGNMLGGETLKGVKQSSIQIGMLSVVVTVIMLMGWLLSGGAGYALAANVITVVSPPDKVWVTEKALFLAGIVSETTITQLEIKGVKNNAPKSKIKVENQAFGVIITLDKGNNEIVLSDGKQQKTVHVYYLEPDALKKGKAAPSGLKRFYVHANPAELDCKECHKLKRGIFNFKRNVPAKANCTTGGCHTDMGKSAHVHGPVGAGVCISCHNPHGSYNDMAIARTGQDLCVVCHQAKIEEFKNSVIHKPVTEGCISCHNPHESSMRFQLRGNGASVSSLCFNCHESKIFTKSHRHGPVGSGDCIACHRPHAGKYKSLLIASPEKGEVCFQCHKDRQQEFSMKYVHAPVQEDCNKCHDPHSSDTRFQLHKEGGQLCADCHEKKSPKLYDAIKNSKFKHEPVEKGRCTDCHRAHSSDVKSMLKKNTEELCFTCHDELADAVAGSQYRHGPVQTGDCMACHDVHGSNNTRILSKYFPVEFYMEYRPENYELCFGCHNKDIAKKKFTKTLTNFRDGEYNLHYFHVNMKKGRSCIACHDPHVSTQAKHIRTEVPFGAWSYPISITKDKNGATCVVGCHAPKSYDRNKPQIKPSR
jgi:predicted CXXCH cytochrome family protein